MNNVTRVLEAYDLKGKELVCEKYGSGHIHATYLIRIDRKSFILQCFNNQVFKYPERISNNQHILSQHLGEKTMPFALPLPFKNIENLYFTEHDQQLFRLFPFVEGVTKDAVEFPQHARLAAEAFGLFIRTFMNVPVEELQDPIPDFHNLSLRYQQLEDSVKNTQVTIDASIGSLIDFYIGQAELVDQYKAYQDALPQRVTHSDTKINNLIFENDLSKVNALIDLDTIMPGFTFYDFGDLVRTVACTKDESSKEWDMIQVDLEKYRSLINGFTSPLKSFISEEEIRSLPYGGEMMTYIMGLRFLADYLNGNIYYRINYPEQNLHRAKNQRALLTSLQKNRDKINQLLEEALI